MFRLCFNLFFYDDLYNNFSSNCWTFVPWNFHAFSYCVSIFWSKFGKRNLLILFCNFICFSCFTSFPSAKLLMKRLNGWMILEIRRSKGFHETLFDWFRFQFELTKLFPIWIEWNGWKRKQLIELTKWMIARTNFLQILKFVYAKHTHELFAYQFNATLEWLNKTTHHMCDDNE